ncbi:MAG: family 43 glycosylhydrolase [Spirochaetales bacterium]|nr:family 43 glycosylhydrolase [Spirochaetales bacterium]
MGKKMFVLSIIICFMLIISGCVTITEPESGPIDPALLIDHPGLNGISRNPIVSHIYTADPTARSFNGRIYIYASHDLDDQTDYRMYDYHIFSSEDLVNWQDHGVGLHKDDISWASLFYAPDCVYNESTGNYYLYFPNGGSSIGVAVSDKPEGPFADAIGKPLITGQYPGVNDVEWVFDPGILIDDDGQAYMYFGGGMPDTGDNARVIRLNEDMVSLKDESATTIIAPDYFEAPFVFKRNGYYYFTYSTNWVGHGIRIDYMMSTDPMKGFTYKGTILNNPPGNHGNNSHHSIVEHEGEWYIFYHNRKLSIREIGNKAIYQRSITLDYVTFNDDGTINLVTPTDGTVEQLKNVDAFSIIEAEMMADLRGVEIEFAYENEIKAGVNVTDIDNYDWTGYSQVDFGEGAHNFNAKVASKTAGTRIEIWIDGLDLFKNTPGTLIGTCKVPNTRNWQAWKNVTCPIELTTGVHDVYLKFTGNEKEDLVNIDYFYFD